MESEREKNRTIHVFVSSTFRDLNDERNYLVNVVFPELIRKARGRGVYVTFIDLRWGIAEDSLSKIISTCLKEIDRAKYFIGILGNTYGTVPDNDEIKDLANVPDNLKEKWIKEGYSLTHIEMDYAVFTKSDIAEYSYFYFKAKEASNSDVNQQDAEKLEKLKNKIRNPNSKWHWSKHEFRSREELGEQIKNDFMNMLDTLYPQESAPSPLEILRSIHSQYSSFLLTNYVEDREKVNEILSALEKEKKVLVTGEVGIGKSSMLAFIKREYEKKNPNALIIEHYIGAGGNETSKDIALHILAEIKDKLKKLKIPFEEKTESDENEIYKEISKLISYIPDWNNSLIIIDAIDQLPNFQEIKFLNFLPEIKILVSCRDGTSTMEHMKSFNYKIITLRQLDTEKIKEIIKNELKEMGKELTDQQINRIAAFKASSNPLYLKTLIDQLSKIGELKKSTETQTQFMDRMIDKHLKPNLEDLYDLMIENLKEILKKYFNNEGALIQFLKLIAVSRSGLSLQEITSMTNIKPAEFAVIRNYLDYHLAEKNGLIDFFHASLKETVFKKYIYNKDLEKETRKIISDWFLKQETDKRQIYELPYQLLALGDKSNLKEYLKKFEVFKLFTEELNTAQYFEFITYLRSSFDNLCKEMVQTYQPQILSLPEDQSSLYLNSLGLLCLTTACYNEAIDSFEKSLEILKKHFGDEHPDVADVLNNLGNVYNDQGKYADAEKMYKQALEIYKKYFGNFHPNVATVLINLGNVYYKQGKYFSAEKMYKQALSIRKKHYGDVHPIVADLLINLGDIYYTQGKYSAAENVYKQALEIYKKYYGDEHLDVATVLINLGLVYKEQGKYNDAENMLEQALEILREKYDDEHPTVADLLNNLGNVYYSQGKYEDAELMYKKALEIYKKHYGDEHLDVAMVLNNLGNVYYSQGQYFAAEIMYRQALSIRKKHYGNGHPAVADV
ncbi:MAG: tetratricopeptide repeat protein, partial [Candidatus Methanomethylicia archaeon]